MFFLKPKVRRSTQEDLEAALSLLNEETIDKTDNIETYFHNFVEGFSFNIAKRKSKEFILIQVWDIREASSGDKRPALMEIYHMFHPNSECDEHKITICIDLKNHNPKMPFHINCDYKSAKVCCPYCKSKFVNEFPEGLNHMLLGTILMQGL